VVANSRFILVVEEQLIFHLTLKRSFFTGEGMRFRDHPLMMYKGNRSWPPAWLWTAGYDTTHPIGEVGILKAVLRSYTEPHDRFF
jgi:hypothetical protein